MKDFIEIIRSLTNDELKRIYKECFDYTNGKSYESNVINDYERIYGEHKELKETMGEFDEFSKIGMLFSGIRIEMAERFYKLLDRSD